MIKAAASLLFLAVAASALTSDPHMLSNEAMADPGKWVGHEVHKMEHQAEKDMKQQQKVAVAGTYATQEAQRNLVQNTFPAHATTKEESEHAASVTAATLQGMEPKTVSDQMIAAAYFLNQPMGKKAATEASKQMANTLADMKPENVAHRAVNQAYAASDGRNWARARVDAEKAAEKNMELAVKEAQPMAMYKKALLAKKNTDQAMVDAAWAAASPMGKTVQDETATNVATVLAISDDPKRRVPVALEAMAGEAANTWANAKELGKQELLKATWKAGEWRGEKGAKEYTDFVAKELAKADKAETRAIKDARHEYKILKPQADFATGIAQKQEHRNEGQRKWFQDKAETHANNQFWGTVKQGNAAAGMAIADANKQKKVKDDRLISAAYRVMSWRGHKGAQQAADTAVGVLNARDKVAHRRAQEAWGDARRMEFAAQHPWKAAMNPGQER